MLGSGTTSSEAPRASSWWRKAVEEDLLPPDPRQWGGLQEAINMPVIRAVVLVETAWWKALQQYGQEVAHWTHRDEPPTMVWNGKVWHIREREAAQFFRKNRGRADSRYTGCPPGSRPDLATAPQRKRAELEDAFEAYKQLHAVMPPSPAAAAGAATPQQRAAVTRSTMLLLRPKHRRAHGIVLWHLANMKVLHAEATVRAVLPRVLAAAAQPMSIVATTGAMTDAAVLGMPHVLPSGAAWLHIAPPATPTTQHARPASSPPATSRSALMHFTQALSHAFLMLWSQRLPWCACPVCKPVSPPRRLQPPGSSGPSAKRQRVVSAARR